MLYEINQDALAYEMEHLGVYPPSVAIMLNKGKIVPLKVLQVRTPAANIIKQEMLAVGGECATPGTTIACSVPFVDILLLGTRKHYNLLLKKLKQMPYFGIPKIVPELECYLQPVPKSTLLADGRRLTYDQMAVMGIINVTPDSFLPVPAARDWMRRCSRRKPCWQTALRFWISGENPPAPAATLWGRKKKCAGSCRWWKP